MFIIILSNKTVITVSCFVQSINGNLYSTILITATVYEIFNMQLLRNIKYTTFTKYSIPNIYEMLNTARY